MLYKSFGSFFLPPLYYPMFSFLDIDAVDYFYFNLAYSIGNCTGEVIDRIFNSVKIKEQGYNSALSVLRMTKRYSNERLETACEIALTKIRTPRYSHLKSILSSNQDQLYLAKKSETQIKELHQSEQGYVRGSEYYGGGDK